MVLLWFSYGFPIKTTIFLWAMASNLLASWCPSAASSPATSPAERWHVPRLWRWRRGKPKAPGTAEMMPLAPCLGGFNGVLMGF